HDARQPQAVTTATVAQPRARCVTRYAALHRDDRARRLGTMTSVDPEPRMSQPHTGSRPAIPRVALLIETQIGPGRDMLQGIARYVRESGPWELHLEPRMQQFV